MIKDDGSPVSADDLLKGIVDFWAAGHPAGAFYDRPCRCLTPARGGAEALDEVANMLTELRRGLMGSPAPATDAHASEACI